jgi:hypothetical protein
MLFIRMNRMRMNNMHHRLRFILKRMTWACSRRAVYCSQIYCKHCRSAQWDICQTSQEEEEEEEEEEVMVVEEEKEEAVQQRRLARSKQNGCSVHTYI